MNADVGQFRMPINRHAPAIGQAAVRSFCKDGFSPEDTLIVFYPSGLNSLCFPILQMFWDRGFHVMVMFWDSTTETYF